MSVLKIKKNIQIRSIRPYLILQKKDPDPINMPNPDPQLCTPDIMDTLSKDDLCSFILEPSTFVLSFMAVFLIQNRSNLKQKFGLTLKKKTRIIYCKKNSIPICRAFYVEIDRNRIQPDKITLFFLSIRIQIRPFEKNCIRIRNYGLDLYHSYN